MNPTCTCFAELDWNKLAAEKLHSEIWCGYLHLGTTVAPHKSLTDGQRVGVHCPMSTDTVVSPATSSSQCRQKPWQTLTVFMIITAQRLGASYLEALGILGKCCSPKFGHSLSFTPHAICRAIAFHNSLPRKVSFSEDSRLSCLQSKTQARRSTLSRRKTEPRIHINSQWHEAQARLLLHSQAINLSK